MGLSVHTDEDGGGDNPLLNVHNPNTLSLRLLSINLSDSSTMTAGETLRQPLADQHQCAVSGRPLRGGRT